MEKLTKISKPIDTILKIINILLITASVICTLIIGILTFVPYFADAPMEGTWSLPLGNVKLELANGVAGIEQIQVELIVAIVSVIVLTVFTCYCIKIMRNILTPMIQAQPFVGTVSRDLKKLGMVVIVNSIVFGIVNYIGTSAIYSAFDISSLLLSDKIVGVSINYSIIDIKTIFVGILLFLLSHVFSYGEKLQQQDDETL